MRRPDAVVPNLQSEGGKKGCYQLRMSLSETLIPSFKASHVTGRHFFLKVSNVLEYFNFIIEINTLPECICLCTIPYYFSVFGKVKKTIKLLSN